MLRIAIAFLILSMLAVSNLPNSLAIEGFEPLGFTLTYDPTMCAIEPADPQIPTVGKTMISETQYAVIDWLSKLNEGVKGKKTWNIDLVIVPLSKQKGFDYSNCDIVIYYLREPLDENLRYIAYGSTQFDFEKNKASIEIYYLQIESLQKKTTTSDSQYTYYKTEWIPYYTNYLITNTQLASVIRHEIGHAIGLGHYHTDAQEKMEQWSSGQQYPDSIMIEEAVRAGVNNMSITSLDVKEMISKYGYDGFGSTDKLESQKKIPASIKTILKIWSSGQRNDIDFYNQIYELHIDNFINLPENYHSSQKQVPQWIKITISWWTDEKIPNNDFLSLIQYLIEKKII